MFIDNQVVKNCDGEESYDKFVISAALMNVSFNGASCSLLEARILNSCEGCNLKFLCSKIDEAVKEYIDTTTVVTNKFVFS